MIVFVCGEIDGDGGPLEFLGGVFAGPVLRVELLDLGKVAGETHTALFEIVRLIADFEQLAVDQRERRGKLFGQLHLLGNKGPLAAGELLKLDLLALQLFALLLDALKFLLSVLEFAVVVVSAAGTCGRRHLHLRRTNPDVVGMIRGGGHR